MILRIQSSRMVKYITGISCIKCGTFTNWKTVSWKSQMRKPKRMMMKKVVMKQAPAAIEEDEELDKRL